MASPKSSKQAKITEPAQDWISLLPKNVTDKILNRLPILMVAKMSVLSKQWRCNWLSLRHLAFDANFWETQRSSRLYFFNEQKASTVISNVLLHHNGPIHKFHLYIPKDIKPEGDIMNISQWLSFLSRNDVQKITLENWFDRTSLPSHIFFCSKLVKLKLYYFTLNTLPIDFKGFPNLRYLVLEDMEFTSDTFASLIAHCPQLYTLCLHNCTGMNHIVIDAPNLRILSIIGIYESLSFKNVQSLYNLYLYLNEKNCLNVEAVDAIKTIASSCELEYLALGFDSCKFLAAGGFVKSLPLEFKHLFQLGLVGLDLNDFGVLCCTYGMIRSCPHIEELIIGVEIETSKNVVHHKFEPKDSYKLGHLRKVTFAGVTGSSVELQLIEYVLSISVVLESFECEVKDAKSELNLSRELNRLPRASPKAKVVFVKF